MIVFRRIHYLLSELCSLASSSKDSKHFLNSEALISSRFNGHTLPRPGKVWLVNIIRVSKSQSVRTMKCTIYYTFLRRRLSGTYSSCLFHNGGYYTNAILYSNVQDLPALFAYSFLFKQLNRRSYQRSSSFRVVVEHSQRREISIPATRGPGLGRTKLACAEL